MHPTHHLTVGLEEHFQATAFDSPIRRRHWEHLESRVERAVERLLDLLAARRARATFFVSGWAAARHPDLVRRLSREGHEVASQGYANELVTAQTPKRFREDVRRAKALLEDLTGLPLWGYRAPGLVISDEVLWALPILVEEGYRYDSSLLPLRWNGAGERAAAATHRLATQAGPLWVAPPTTVGLGPWGVAVADGVALRLLPYPWLQRLWQGLETQGRPVVMALRTWELDPGQPRMAGRMRDRFQQYVNLEKAEARLACLLADFRFEPLREAMVLDEAACVA